MTPILQLHPLRMTDPLAVVTPLRMTDPLAVVTPPPSVKPGRTVWLNTRPRWDSEAEESKTFFSPWGVATQFMVMHRRAKCGYKRYRFSPWHPSSWWCTAVPSVVTKGTDSPHDIPVHGDAPPCQVWLQKVQILPMTSQFMVMHRRAKCGYKRYRFSPWHPSSWWCTAVPSVVTKGTDSPHDIPVHGDAPPCQVWLQKVLILPMTSQFMVMHRRAKCGYKRYRFSPWHPSSWWCTAVPSVVTKGRAREVQKITAWIKPLHMDRWTHTSSTPSPPHVDKALTHGQMNTHIQYPPPPPPLKKPSHMDRWTHTSSTPRPPPRWQSPHTWTDEHTHPVPPPPPPRLQRPHTRTDEHTHSLSPPPHAYKALTHGQMNTHIQYPPPPKKKKKPKKNNVVGISKLLDFDMGWLVTGL